jgi:hypothetical protein
MPGARVLALTDELPMTRIYCGPNATIDVHNNPNAPAGETSDVHPDYWLHPDAAVTDVPHGRFGVSAAFVSAHGGACVWGGTDAGGQLSGDGSFFDSAGLTWHAMASAGAPAARVSACGVSMGNAFFVWGGRGASGLLGDGAVFSPPADWSVEAGTWSAVALDGDVPEARSGHGAAYDPAGDIVYVWGGIVAGADAESATNTGSGYDRNAASGHWLAMTPTGAPTPRTDPFVLWSTKGSGQLVVWGGRSSSGGEHFNDGGVYVPSIDTWVRIPQSLDVDPRRGVAEDGGTTTLVDSALNTPSLADGSLVGWMLTLPEANESRRVTAFDVATGTISVGTAFSAPTLGMSYVVESYAPPPAVGRSACLTPGGHLLVYGGIIEQNGSFIYDHLMYDLDPTPASPVWAAHVEFGVPWRAHLGFTLIHTELGTRNNIITVGGRVSGAPVAGFIK